MSKIGQKMITEIRTKRDVVTHSRITMSYPIRFKRYLFDDPMVDPVLLYKFKTGDINIDDYIGGGNKYIPAFRNSKQVANFLRCTFFCDINNSGKLRRSIYFIELKKYAWVDILETTALIDTEPFCKKIKIFQYLKQYWQGVDIVGKFDIIRVTMPSSLLHNYDI